MSMFTTFRDYITPGSLGIDVYGDPCSNRIKFEDDLNRYMFNNMIREYIKWHEENHRFYDGYEKDRSTLNYYAYSRYFWAFVGFTFVGMVINPNYTGPKAFYMRKFNALFGAICGYSYGNRNYNNQMTYMNIRMLDYFPMEVKRALRTQDYRYLALFDYKNPDRKLFDDKTGKSLS